MPQANSVYQRTKEHLLAHPGEYLTSKALMEALKLEDPESRRRVGKTLSALAASSATRIERRQNDDGRYEYAFTGEEQPAPKQDKAPKPRKGSKASEKGAARSSPSTKPSAQGPENAKAGRLKKLANLIRAYLDLSEQEQQEACEWLKEQPQ